MKHTKGEWRIFPSSNKLIQINSEKMHSVCDVWAINGESKEELEANAKLIAAAPYLLEALIEVEEWAAKFGLGKDQYNKVINAINKATP